MNSEICPLKLEYSIVANLADDILVDVKCKFVDIAIKKTL